MNPDDPTTPATEPEVSGTSRRSSPLVLGGYELGEVLGRGGMGEVLLARDRRIGRRVAIKRMRGADPTDHSVARFLREARVQARLDHPAIVPVYEVGDDAEGRPYFTMKRLSGVTLAATLAAGASLQRLLRAFVDVCRAIDFAHSRDVVHRDLKPSNIMLGEFGEVYVLDWGIARVIGDHPDTRDSGLVDTLEGGTQEGAILGTPGYLAPEQARGDEVGPPADVYALGCTLFEILAGESLHSQGQAALVHMVMTPTESPAARAPARAIAPELDAACVAALAEDPAGRLSAHELAERIQLYLDGDRDLESRRALAVELLVHARAALASGDRANAIRLAGRSLALDRDSVDSAALVTKLIVEPPRELPRELLAHLHDVEDALARKQWRVSGIAFLTFVAFFPFLLWQGVTSWGTVAIMYGVVAGVIAVSFYNQRQQHPSPTVALILNYGLIVLMTRLLGPFILVPSVICMQTQSWVAYPSLVERPWRPVVMMTAALALPIVAEACGVLKSTWAVTDHAIVSSSAVLALGGLPTVVILLASTVVTIAVTAVLGRSLAVSRRTAQERAEIQAWHLRQMLPD